MSEITETHETDTVTTILSTSQSTSKELMLNPVAHVLFIMRYHGWTGQGGITINEPYQAYQYAWNWILPIHISPDKQVTFDPMNAPTYCSAHLVQCQLVRGSRSARTLAMGLHPRIVLVNERKPRCLREREVGQPE
jgi:hypothetical protein